MLSIPWKSPCLGKKFSNLHHTSYKLHLEIKDITDISPLTRKRFSGPPHTYNVHDGLPLFKTYKLSKETKKRLKHQEHRCVHLHSQHPWRTFHCWGWYSIYRDLTFPLHQASSFFLFCHPTSLQLYNKTSFSLTRSWKHSMAYPRIRVPFPSNKFLPFYQFLYTHLSCIRSVMV